MNPFDLFAIALLLLAVAVGAGAGFLRPVLGLAGAAIGFGLALLLASVAQANLAEIEQPLRATVALLGLSVLVLSGEAAGAGIGATLSRSIHVSAMRPIDLVGGGLVGLAHGILLVWLAGGMLIAGVLPPVARAAQASVVLRAIYERLPAPAALAGRLVALFEATALPSLFAGLEPPPAAPVDLPDDAEARALAESSIPSTVRVEASGCQLVQVGTGFFVTPKQAVTNAHVVAGTDSTTVTLGGTTFAATVVFFDADADLALLDVADASAAPIELAAEPVQRGDTGVALGFPGGGPLSVSPAGVTATIETVGPDIYDQGEVARSVVEIRADIAHGNSGGPLVTAPGVAGGIVFGASQTRAGVAYAISAPWAAERIAPGLGSSQPVDTGPCR